MKSWLFQKPRYVAELVDLLKWIGLRSSELLLLLGLTLGQTLTDGLGVALVYPVLAFVANGAEAFASSAPFPLPQIAGAIEKAGLPLGLPVLLGIVFGTFMVREGFSYLRASTVSRVANLRASTLQAKALRHYVEADLPFHTTHNRGVFLASVANDCVQSGTLISLVTEALSLTLMGVFYTAVLLTLSVPLTLMIGAGALVALPLFRGQARRVREIGGKFWNPTRRSTFGSTRPFRRFAWSRYGLRSLRRRNALPMLAARWLAVRGTGIAPTLPSTRYRAHCSC